MTKAISKNTHTTLQVFLPVFRVVEALTQTSLCTGSTPCRQTKILCNVTVSVNRLRHYFKMLDSNESPKAQPLYQPGNQWGQNHLFHSL